MKKTDLCWLLGWPFYQLVGTARHELSHAVVAVLQGAQLTQLQILPSFDREGFLWGYVTWIGGHTNTLVTAAPYLCDFALFLIFLPLCMAALRAPRWLWINALIIGVLSPFVDTAANYSKFLLRDSGDVHELASHFSSLAVHLVFPAVLLFYLIGMVIGFTVRERR